MNRTWSKWAQIRISFTSALSSCTRKSRGNFISSIATSSSNLRILSFLSWIQANIPRNSSLTSLPQVVHWSHRHCSWMNGQVSSKTWLNSWKNQAIICFQDWSCLKEYLKSWEWPIGSNKGLRARSRNSFWPKRVVLLWYLILCLSWMMKIAFRQCWKLSRVGSEFASPWWSTPL